MFPQVLSTRRALLQGFYLVPVPPHPTVRCDDRTAIWQIWVPAAELTLLTHYAASSLPSRVLSVLEMILQQLRGRTSRQALGGFGLPVIKNQARTLNLLPPLFLLIWGRSDSHVCRAGVYCYGRMAGVACHHTAELNWRCSEHEDIFIIFVIYYYYYPCYHLYTGCLTRWGRRHLNCLNAHSRCFNNFNPLNAELIPICYLRELLAHHFLHVSRIRVKSLTLRLLMSYIYMRH